MLKELSKSGHGQQALELFDCLQNLPPNHDLAPLADVFSYTTGKHHFLHLKHGLTCSSQSSIVSASSFSSHDRLLCPHESHQALHAMLAPCSTSPPFLTLSLSKIVLYLAVSVHTSAPHPDICMQRNPQAAVE